MDSPVNGTPDRPVWVRSAILIPKAFDTDLRGMYFRLCQERLAANTDRVPSWSEFLVGLIELAIQGLVADAKPPGQA